MPFFFQLDPVLPALVLSSSSSFRPRSGCPAAGGCHLRWIRAQQLLSPSSPPLPPTKANPAAKSPLSLSLSSSTPTATWRCATLDAGSIFFVVSVRLGIELKAGVPITASVEYRAVAVASWGAGSVRGNGGFGEHEVVALLVVVFATCSASTSRGVFCCHRRPSSRGVLCFVAHYRCLLCCSAQVLCFNMERGRWLLCWPLSPLVAQLLPIEECFAFLLIVVACLVALLKCSTFGGALLLDFGYCQPGALLLDFGCCAAESSTTGIFLLDDLLVYLIYHDVRR